MSKKRWLAIRITIIMSVILSIIFVYFGYFREKYAYDKTDIKFIYHERGMAVVFGLLCADLLVCLMLCKITNSQKPKKYSLKQNNYEEFSNYLSNRIKIYNYELYDSNDIGKFYRREIKRNIYYVIDVKVDELSEESFEELYNDKIFPIIDEDFIKMQDKRYSLYVTMIISVDRITPMFYKYIDSGNIDKRFYKYPVGISYGSNQIYITGDESFGFNTNKKMVKEAKEILEIETVKKMKN